MDSAQFRELVPVIYGANMIDDAHVAPLIIGPIGHGKTSLGHVAAYELTQITGRHYIVYEGQPMLEPLDDIRGMGVPMRDADETLIAAYTWPHILPSLGMLDHAVWVLDEFTKAPEDAMLGLGACLLTRRLGDAVIPKETFIILTGNRAGVDKSRDKTVPAHVIARTLPLEFRQTFRSWRGWAMAHGVHPITQAFANAHEGDVFAGEEPKKNEAFLSPRELTEADKLIKAWLRHKGKDPSGVDYPVDDPLLSMLVAGKIGQRGAEMLKAYASVGQQMPTWEDIVRKPGQAKVPSISGALGAPALYAVASMVAGKLDATTIAPAVKYMKRLPDEFQIPILVRLGVDFTAEAGAEGVIDMIMKSYDLLQAATSYRTGAHS